MITTPVKNKNQKKVVCAMSGGIDSSVAAALLKKAGFDVIGVFMKFWMASKKDGIKAAWNKCCSPEAELRARKVAEILKIPFYVLNFEKEFKKKVVDYFLNGYEKGITPNPCVVCNKEIKFGLLLEKALKLNADFVATGHYALKRETKNQIVAKFPMKFTKIKNYQLLKGKDKTKDQSYFLWQLNQKQLNRILFPLGQYTKAEVRSLSKKFKLPVFNIPESQEICFISTTINDFLSRYLKPKPGPIITSDNKKIGQHRGLFFYTIGQRKGINVPGGPYYVIKKDLKKNRLIVASFPSQKELCQKSLIVEKINWISGQEPELPLKIKAQIRYRQEPVAAKIFRGNFKKKNYKIIFSQPQRAITPGQSVVFYSVKINRSGRDLLGGGIINTSGENNY